MGEDHKDEANTEDRKEATDEGGDVGPEEPLGGHLPLTLE